MWNCETDSDWKQMGINLLKLMEQQQILVSFIRMIINLTDNNLKLPFKRVVGFKRLIKNV